MLLKSDGQPAHLPERTLLWVCEGRLHEAWGVVHASQVAQVASINPLPLGDGASLRKTAELSCHASGRCGIRVCLGPSLRLRFKAEASDQNLGWYSTNSGTGGTIEYQYAMITAQQAFIPC